MGELKRVYRALVKRWHPDRYGADPVGQAEATRQLRMINGAMRVVVRHLAGRRSAAPSEGNAHNTAYPAGDWSECTEEARPLSRAELDGMIRAVSAESPVETVLGWVGDVGPFVVGLLCFVPQHGGVGPTMRDTIVGIVCIVGGTARLLWRSFKRAGGGRPTS
jgi:hypothetical protein